MNNNINPKSREDELVIQQLNDELFIYDLKTDRVYSLNPTSAFVWNNLNGKISIEDLTAKIGKHFNQPIGEELIWLAVDELRKLDLLEEATAPKAMSKLKRREAIKRIGLATMIALPVISMLVAPTALQAASGNSGAVCETCTGTNRTQGTCNPGLFCLTQVPPGPPLCATSNLRSDTGQRGYVFAPRPSPSSCVLAATYCCSGTAAPNPPNNSCICT